VVGNKEQRAVLSAGTPLVNSTIAVVPARILVAYRVLFYKTPSPLILLSLDNSLLYILSCRRIQSLVKRLIPLQIPSLQSPPPGKHASQEGHDCCKGSSFKGSVFDQEKGLEYFSG
jgi:hypothetical protein